MQLAVTYEAHDTDSVEGDEFLLLPLKGFAYIREINDVISRREKTLGRSHGHNQSLL